ncbi:hypothetical protein BST81_11170 [Leptolyngbya sp. 'hensonii']|uniref:hypothetical protein n=1 Tax=Leptolyngbya sp. 'hensonii' TaxID=1922337 RepID=UPI00096A06BB|nr:hypothetical protein [Leptolyngbya sp. 'hensonii']OLP18348.1 hypothetical protein BST81_11170 [Leptolyngbya sp. 'hensonii']
MTTNFMLTRNVQPVILMATTLAALLFSVTPLQAQLSLKTILQHTPQSRLLFSPYTVGAVISGAGDRVYVLKAQKGQVLKITVHSLGARAFVAVFTPEGQRLTLLDQENQTFEAPLTGSGNYYVFCYSGPTLHFYDLTIRID